MVRPALTAITAGRSVRNTPNPRLTRLPYAAFSSRGTNPAEISPPSPGLKPRQAAAYLVYPPSELGDREASAVDAATARSCALFAGHLEPAEPRVAVVERQIRFDQERVRTLARLLVASPADRGRPDAVRAKGAVVGRRTR